VAALGSWGRRWRRVLLERLSVTACPARPATRPPGRRDVRCAAPRSFLSRLCRRLGETGGGRSRGVGGRAATVSGSGWSGPCSGRAGRGGRGVQHRRRPQPGAAGAGRWPPRPVPGRSWTQRGRRRRARCGAGAGLPPGRGPAGGDYDQTPAQFRGPLEQLYAHHFRTITALRWRPVRSTCRPGPARWCSPSTTRPCRSTPSGRRRRCPRCGASSPARSLRADLSAPLPPPGSETLEG